jgi:Flp pilus assembly protein TadG
MTRLARFLNRFTQDKHSAIAIITAIIIFPLIFYCAGTPIDLARQVQLRSALQNIADGAALAASADIGAGGTASQACTIASSYVKASALGLTIGYSSLTSPNAGLDPSYSGSNFATTKNMLNGSTGCQTGAPNITTLAALETTAPNQITVTIAANLPATFMAVMRKNLPVSVTSTAIGPGNFITVCMQPQSSSSADFNSLFYYGITQSGALFDVGATGTAPVAFTEGGGNDPSLQSGLPQKLDDDTGAGPTFPITPGTPQCKSGYFKAFVHLPLGARIGFEMTSEKGGLYPCLYASNYNAAGLAAGNAAGAFPPAFKSSGQCMTSGTIPAPGSGSAPAITNFFTDAYGDPVFTTVRYYSTDYPATLNSSTTSTVPAGGTAGNFGPTNQASVVNTTYVAPVISGTTVNTIPQTNAHEMFFNSIAQIAQLDGPPQNYAIATPTADLVCLVNNGLLLTPSSITQYSNLGAGINFTNVNNIGNAQEQNLAIVNPAQGNVMQCANTTDGSPDNIDPTCQELNGATIQAFWNDMGSPGYDNVGYGDMPYSFGCATGSGVATLDYQNPALIQ